MADKGFDPSRYLTKVGSADYLEIKWRLVWLREMHPDAVIETDLHHADDQSATFKARVAIPGGGSATGWASETYSDFRDFLEKAETKALGRALAALGFGTQFTYDFDGPIADSPVDRSRGQGATNAPREHVNTETGEITRGAAPVARAGQSVTPNQIKFMHALAEEKKLTHDDLHAMTMSKYGTGVGTLDRRDASAFVDYLKAFRPGVDTVPVVTTQAPTPIRQSAPPLPAEDGENVSYTEFWNYARSRNVDAKRFVELTQQGVEGKTPEQLRTLLDTTLASMPKATGTAGNDRYTS